MCPAEDSRDHMCTEPAIPGETWGTGRLWGIMPSWCQCSGSALGKRNRWQRVVAAAASHQTPPDSWSCPVIGRGFKMSCQCQNDPHYRFQITVHNVCREREGKGQFTATQDRSRWTNDRTNTIQYSPKQTGKSKTSPAFIKQWRSDETVL